MGLDANIRSKKTKVRRGTHRHRVDAESEYMSLSTITERRTQKQNTSSSSSLTSLAAAPQRVGAAYDDTADGANATLLCAGGTRCCVLETATAALISSAATRGAT